MTNKFDLSHFSTRWNPTAKSVVVTDVDIETVRKEFPSAIIVSPSEEDADFLVDADLISTLNAVKPKFYVTEVITEAILGLCRAIGCEIKYVELENPTVTVISPSVEEVKPIVEEAVNTALKQVFEEEVVDNPVAEMDDESNTIVDFE